MTATPRSLIAAALAERGYTESPPGSNCNKFAREAHLKDCTYWCGGFTSALLIREKVPVPPGVLTLSTRANAAAWKVAGQWVEPADIQPGDVTFAHLTGRNGPWPTPDHTFFAVTARATESVEGNTSPDQHGSQDNGGGVWVKHRPASVIIGAGRPKWATPPAPKPLTEDDAMTIYIPTDDAGNEHDANGKPIGVQIVVQGNRWTELVATAEHDVLVLAGADVQRAKPLAMMFLQNQLTEHRSR